MAGGFALLGLCVIAGKAVGQLAKAALVFLPLWLIGAGINMWIGVAKAGYSVKDEFPIFIVIFAVPAMVAIVLWRKFSAR